MKPDYRREQRLARRLTVIVAVLVVAIATPLIFLPALRLEIGQRLNLVPGANADRLYGPGAPVELVVLTQDVPVALSQPYKRYTAVYIAERTGGVVVLHDLNHPRDVTVPLPTYDLIAASKDRSRILFVDHSGAQVRAVLVTVATGAVDPLPPGDVKPDIPGDWGTDVGESAMDCDGASPHDTYVACIRGPRGGTRYIFGSWELQVTRFGAANTDVQHLFRGRGSDPIAGWTTDESTIYFWNETGLWKVGVGREA